MDIWTRRLKQLATSAAVALGGFASLATVGCGAYEPEPEYPRYVAPQPPTAAELAAQQKARAEAQAANREVFVGAAGSEESGYQDTDPSALTEFKPALEGHGTWVEDNTYGTVWVPAAAEVGSDFQPYVTAGHWTYSDATDYVWVSDYSWGWAPFHYGRWVYLPGYGWSWIPGRRYSGAWVTWRVGPSGYGYVGWAPAPPSWYWYRGGVYGWSFGFYRHHDHYVYCPQDRVYSDVVSSHVVRGPGAAEHHGRTADYVPASPAVGGPDRVAANPTVSPSLDGQRNGGNLAPAAAAGGGRVIANPKPSGGGRDVTRGPRPNELGLDNTVVVAPPQNDPGLDRARAAAVPRPNLAATRPSLVPSEGGSRGPATSSLVPSNPQVGAFRPVAPSPMAPNVPSPSPRVEGPGPTPSYIPSRPSAVARPVFPPSIVGSSAAARVDRPSSSFFSSSPSPRISGPSSSPSFSSGSFRSSPSVGAIRPSPSIRSTPSPSFRPSASPVLRSSPSFSSSVRAAPVVRPSMPSAAVRSSPSVGSIRSASPTIRSSPSIRRR